MSDRVTTVIDRLAALASTLFLPPYRSDAQREAFGSAASALARGVLADDPGAEVVRRATMAARFHLASQDADVRVAGYLLELDAIDQLAGGLEPHPFDGRDDGGAAGSEA